MTPPAPPAEVTPVDLQSLPDEDYAAINNEAVRRGVSFDEVASSMLQEHAKKLRARARTGGIAQLFRFAKASNE